MPNVVVGRLSGALGLIFSLRPTTACKIVITETCGRTVHGLWVIYGFTSRLTHRLRASFYAWVQPYGFMDSLYYFGTQVLPNKNAVYVSVNGQFYPPSTPPIKTTTSLKELYIRLYTDSWLLNSRKDDL